MIAFLFGRILVESGFDPNAGQQHAILTTWRPFSLGFSRSWGGGEEQVGTMQIQCKKNTKGLPILGETKDDMNLHPIRHIVEPGA